MEGYSHVFFGLENFKKYVFSGMRLAALGVLRIACRLDGVGGVRGEEVALALPLALTLALAPALAWP